MTEIEIAEPVGGGGNNLWGPVSSLRRSVLDNLESIFTIEPGELPLHPDFGFRVGDLEDELEHAELRSDARVRARGVITRYEKRLEITTLEVTTETSQEDGVSSRLVIHVVGVLQNREPLEFVVKWEI